MGPLRQNNACHPKTKTDLFAENQEALAEGDETSLVINTSSADN